MEKVNEIERELRQMAGADPVEEPKDTAVQSANPSGDPAGGQGGPWIEPNARYEALQEQQRMIGYQNRLSAAVPSLWPASGELSSPYGLRWGGSDFHPGVDIANDYGTPIVAAASGTVTAAGWNSGGYGNMVDIDHGNGIWTRYGHAEAVVVTVGETVQKGQLIAYMGSTGFSTGPHVHYEVHANGELVNPILYLGGE